MRATRSTDKGRREGVKGKTWGEAKKNPARETGFEGRPSSLKRKPDATKPATTNQRDRAGVSPAGRERAGYQKVGSPARKEHPAFSQDKSGRKQIQVKAPNKKLRDDSTKDAEGSRSDFLAGRNPVMEALRSGRPISKIFILAGERQGSVREIIGLAKDKGILVQETEQGKLDLMSSGIRHQGVVALVSPVPYSSVEDILLYAQSKGERPCIVLLDGLKDPQNLGNLIRSAEVAGAHGVLIPQRRNVQLSGAVAKAAAGAVEYMKVAQVGNVAQTLEGLKKQGLWIIGADAAAEQDYFETDLTGPVVIVIGGEGEGMARLTKERCDKLVRIPVKGRISSLNAATAGAVLLFDVARQRSIVKH